MTDLATAALDYAARGWAVFPVHSIRDGICTCGEPSCPRPGKHPVGHLTPHGLNDASTDRDKVLGWWKTAPWANIGIATGRASGRLMVVDIDIKPERGQFGEDSWLERQKEYGKVHQVVGVMTGSGGQHLYFRYPESATVRSGQDVLGPAVDIRADGGYVIAPPSKHISGQEYFWDADWELLDIPEAPDWLVHLASSRPREDSPADTPETPLAPEQVREIRSALTCVVSDSRDTWCEIGMALHSTGAGEQAYGLWAEWSQQSDKYDPKDQRRTWKSFKGDSGITLSTLFFRAKKSGWIDLPRAVAAPVSAADSELLDWQESLAGRFLTPPPPQEWLLENLLPRKTVGALFAAGGTGKSFLLLELAFALASGASFGPFRPAGRSRVLYMASEDPDHELHRRVWYVANALRLLNSPHLADNLGVVSLAGKSDFLVALNEHNNPCTTSSYEWLCRSIQRIPGLDVLILDPMSRLYGLNENDNTHATYWISVLERLVDAYGITVLFAHHEPKSANHQQKLRDSSGRGASALRDGCRWTAALRWMTDEDAQRFGVDPRQHVEFDTTKANYSPHLSSPQFFRRGENGVLMPVNLRAVRLDELARVLAEALKHERPMSRRELVQRKEGQAIREALADSDGSFKKSNARDMEAVVDRAIHLHLIAEQEITDGPGIPKKILYTLESEVEKFMMEVPEWAQGA